VDFDSRRLLPGVSYQKHFIYNLKQSVKYFLTNDSRPY
jgi:hypothetical protein